MTLSENRNNAGNRFAASVLGIGGATAFGFVAYGASKYAPGVNPLVAAEALWKVGKALASDNTIISSVINMASPSHHGMSKNRPSLISLMDNLKRSTATPIEKPWTAGRLMKEACDTAGFALCCIKAMCVASVSLLSDQILDAVGLAKNMSGLRSLDERLKAMEMTRKRDVSLRKTNQPSAP